MNSFCAKEKGLWEKIIKTFNNRFHVPFKVKLTNQSDVLLKQKVAKLEFIFNNDLSESPTSKHKDEIIKILSKGEQRAFHILQILFEIESRIGSEKNHLLVFDDIADSFDYKNKYAIIEYIKDLDREGTFKQIILTHNFDFFRTVSRRILSRKNSFIAVRDNGIISLFNVNTKGCDIRDSPFLIWKKNLTNQVYLIATIPFVRNLIEYKTGDKDNNYMSLTSLLHIKKDTFKINFRDIERIFNEVIGNVDLPCDLLGQNIFDIIIPTCKKLCSRSNDKLILLADKVCLSIGIRLLAEQYMIYKIKEHLPPLSKNQTGKLLELYKKEYENIDDEKENIYACVQVGLMTPENIHLNSFMFEPILDLSVLSLKELFVKFDRLIAPYQDIREVVLEKIRS